MRWLGGITVNGHGCGWTLGVGDGQGGLECCGSWGRKESDMTEQLNWTDLQKTANFKCWQGCREKELSCHVDGNVNWYSHNGKQYEEYSLKNKRERKREGNMIQLFFFWVFIWRMGEHLNRYMHPPPATSTAALFMIVKIWKQPKCPYCCFTVAKSYPTVRDPMDCSMPGLPVPHYWSLVWRILSITFLAYEMSAIIL